MKNYILETPKGRKIHKCDFRVGYEPLPKDIKPLKCAGCGIIASHALHWGVYLTTVSYAVFHSPECAAQHGDEVYDAD